VKGVHVTAAARTLHRLLLLLTGEAWSHSPAGQLRNIVRLLGNVLARCPAGLAALASAAAKEGGESTGSKGRKAMMFPLLEMLVELPGVTQQRQAGRDSKGELRWRPMAISVSEWLHLMRQFLLLPQSAVRNTAPGEIAHLPWLSTEMTPCELPMAARLATLKGLLDTIRLCTDADLRAQPEMATAVVAFVHAVLLGDRRHVGSKISGDTDSGSKGVAGAPDYGHRGGRQRRDRDVSPTTGRVGDVAHAPFAAVPSPPFDFFHCVVAPLTSAGTRGRTAGHGMAHHQLSAAESSACLNACLLACIQALGGLAPALHTSLSAASVRGASVVPIRVDKAAARQAAEVLGHLLRGTAVQGEGRASPAGGEASAGSAIVAQRLSEMLMTGCASVTPETSGAAVGSTKAAKASAGSARAAVPTVSSSQAFRIASFASNLLELGGAAAEAASACNRLLLRPFAS
jgi:hypothetical protein